MQNLMDTQAVTFAASGAFSYQASARDEAFNWADYNGIPKIISEEDSKAAYLVSREGDVPNYLVPFDVAAAITINTTNVWPGGSTGFNLTGTNTAVSMWDEASPRQAVAKNNLVVGAVQPLANGYNGSTNLFLASFSSSGPTDDGRIKPDIVGDGVNNWVPISSSDYNYGVGRGTSFASPSVAGSVNLLRQFYQQLHPYSAEPLASTLKGVLIETADSGTTNNGPSYKFGWGVMNTKTAATFINQDATNGVKNQIKVVMLGNGQCIQFPIVSAGNSPLKVTICWTDPYGSPNSVTDLNDPAIKLINDLDLQVISPNGTTNFPWILNPDLTNRTFAARSAVATTGDDNRNNVEQVYIPSPANGTYTVKMTHKGTLTNSQWVSILISGNVAQQPPALRINQILQTATNQMAVGWPTVVGAQYQVQGNNNVATTNWFNIGGIISARLTNVVAQVPKTNALQFYRIIQLP